MKDQKDTDMKKTLRDAIKKRRLAITETDVKTQSAACVKKLMELIGQLPEDAGAIALYMPANREVDVADMIPLCRQLGRTVAVPRVEGYAMEFYEIHDTDDCEKGHFGILEPKPDCRRISGAEISLMIVPGVVFDPEGHRLGYGGGFYDRYLERYPDIIKIAVAYELQMTEEIPAEDHDVRMDYVITAERLIAL